LGGEGGGGGDRKLRGGKGEGGVLARPNVYMFGDRCEVVVVVVVVVAVVVVVVVLLLLLLLLLLLHLTPLLRLMNWSRVNQQVASNLLLPSNFLFFAIPFSNFLFFSLLLSFPFCFVAHSVFFSFPFCFHVHSAAGGALRRVDGQPACSCAAGHYRGCASPSVPQHIAQLLHIAIVTQLQLLHIAIVTHNFDVTRHASHAHTDRCWQNCSNDQKHERRHHAQAREHTACAHQLGRQRRAT
jgi:hypothetical protein